MTYLYDNRDIVMALMTMITSSFFLISVLIIFKQTWITTFAHASTIVALPVITYVITKVISGNIALSLGMVGALSIVRFRNPVKSPLELATYFTAITIGIATAVSLKWTFALSGMLLVALVLLKIYYIVVNLIFGLQLPRASFSEGNELSTLEVHSDSEATALQNSAFLVSYGYADGLHKYYFASQSVNELEKLRKKLPSTSVKFVQLQR